jgi:hypothetical protein
LAGGVLLASPAHADGQQGDLSIVSYRNELNREGVPISLSDAGDLATGICQRLHDGVKERQLVGAAMRGGLTANQAGIAVVGAEFHFCPQA